MSTNIKTLEDTFKQYQSMQTAVAKDEEAVATLKDQAVKVQEQVSGLEQVLVVNQEVLKRDETALKTAITDYINVQKETLVQATKLLDNGDVVKAYQVLMGQEIDSSEQKKSLVDKMSPNVADIVANVSQTEQAQSNTQSGIKVVSIPGHIIGLGADYKVKWKYSASCCIPKYSQDHNFVYVPMDNQLILLDAKTGNQISSTKLVSDPQVLRDLVCSEGILYVAHDYGVSAFDAKTLGKKWTNAECKYGFRLIKSGNNLVVSSREGFYNIDLKGNCGRAVSRIDKTFLDMAPSSSNDGTFYTCSYEDRLIQKWGNNHRPIWSLQVNLPSLLMLKEQDNILYLSLKSGQLMAIDTEKGKELWKTRFGSGFDFTYHIDGTADKLELIVYNGLNLSNLKIVHIDPKTGEKI